MALEKSNNNRQPLPRFYHAGAKVKDKSVYIYGGIHVGRSSKLLSDFHIYVYSKLNKKYKYYNFKQNKF